MMKKRGIVIPAAHNSVFNMLAHVDQLNTRLYTNQLRAYLKNEEIIKGKYLEICPNCEEFHTKNLKNINKKADINFGKQLEDCFKDFLESQLNSKGCDVEVKHADTENLHMPDLKIINRKDKKVLCYFEFKAIFRPYIKIKEKVNLSYECYLNSLTLDLENGKKLREQRNLVENELKGKEVYYVYLYDIPCIKGIYWIPSTRVYQHMDQQVPYNRKNVEGDFNQHGIKIGATNKIYIPLLETDNLQNLLRKLYILATR